MLKKIITVLRQLGADEWSRQCVVLGQHTDPAVQRLLFSVCDHHSLWPGASVKVVIIRIRLLFVAKLQILLH